MFIIPVWIGYVFVGAVVTGLSFYGFNVWKNNNNPLKGYKDVPNTLIPVKIKGKIDLLTFGVFFNKALEFIANSHWSLDEIKTKIPNVLFEVMPTKFWKDEYGRTVGGQVVRGLVKIGPNCDVVCHELIHVCEEKLDGQADIEFIVVDGKMVHKTWPARNLDKADMGYRQWLDTYKKSS